MKDEIIISVVVPCFNAEKYICSCIDSILNQSFSKFEVILVDDGSMDQTGKFIDVAAQDHGNIKAIHQSNQGVMKARKAGFLAAEGDWITFVDADDTLKQGALETLYNGVSKSDSTDIIITSTIKTVKRISNSDYSLAKYRRNVIAGNGTLSSVWGKLYRKAMLTPELFEIPKEIIRGEDMIFNIKCAFATSKCPVFLEKNIYNYNRQNEKSVTHTFVTNPEYELLFYKIKIHSIPKETVDIYMKSIIEDNFHPIQWWSYNNALDTRWLKSEFVKRLKYEIFKYSYNLTIKQKILLSENYIIRLFGVSFYRLRDFIVNKIS